MREPEPGPNGGELVTAHVARIPELAQLAVQRLAAEGIPGVVHGDLEAASAVDSGSTILACTVMAR
jgi:hypothetical protein